MKYSTKLKKMIKDDLGYGQNQYAAKRGISNSTMSGWINSEYPPLELIEMVCEDVNMPLYRFFMSEQDVNDFMGIDPEWLEIGKIIQPYPAEIKNFFYGAIHLNMKALHAALLELKNQSL